MVEKKTISEIVYAPGENFESVESRYFTLRGENGPKYRFDFQRGYSSVVEAFSNNDYKIKRVSDGEVVMNPRAIENLSKNLLTIIRK